MKKSRREVSGGSRQQSPPGERELFVDYGRRATAISAAAQRIVQDLDKNASFTNLKKTLGSLREELRGLMSLNERLDSTESSWSDRMQREFLEIEASTREALTSRGWHVEGQWPRLYVARGIVLEFDELNRSFKVSDRKISSGTVADVIAVLEPLIADLIPRSFSEPKFIQSLADAYDDMASNSSQVLILDVYRQVVLRQQKPTFWKDARSDAFIGMSVDQFRARLSRVLEKGAMTDARGREIRLLPPIDPKNAIFLYQPAEGRFGFVGRIEFISSQQMGL
jgi:hypothetical protein